MNDNFFIFIKRWVHLDVCKSSKVSQREDGLWKVG